MYLAKFESFGKAVGLLGLGREKINELGGHPPRRRRCIVQRTCARLYFLVFSSNVFLGLLGGSTATRFLGRPHVPFRHFSGDGRDFGAQLLRK